MSESLWRKKTSMAKLFTRKKMQNPKKEKFRQSKKNKLYSKSIQAEMRNLKGQGYSREKTCQILNVPLVEERSWRRYTNSQNCLPKFGTATCTFNRPFSFITCLTRVEFEKSVVSMFRQRSISNGISHSTLELCCKEVMKFDKFKNDPYLSKVRKT